MIYTLILAFAIFRSAYGQVGLALGGYGSSNSIELITKDGICEGKDMNPVLAYVPAANPTWVSEYVEDTVYLCGGQNAEGQLRDCYAYMPGQDANFRKVCPVNNDRKYMASLVFKGEMMVMGGYNDFEGWLDTIDLKPTGQCEFVTKTEWKMMRGMYNFCAVSHEDKIYTIGGSVYAFLANSDIGKVDVLDTTTNTWSAAESLPRNRSASGCATYELNGQMGILVAGGCDDSCHEHLDDTLFFSFSTEKWEVLPAKLNIPRMGMRMVMIDGKPTVAGGYYKDLMESIEQFDGTQWTTSEQKFTFGRYQYGMPSTLPEGVFTC